jgi:hypothetical protein
MLIEIRLECITKKIEIDKNCTYDELKKKIEKKFKDNINVGFSHILFYNYKKQNFFIYNDEDVKKYILNGTPLLYLESLMFINDYSNCCSNYIVCSNYNDNEKFSEYYDDNYNF